MPLYEHIFLARQDVSGQQVDALTAQVASAMGHLGRMIRLHEQAQAEAGRLCEAFSVFRVNCRTGAADTVVVLRKAYDELEAALAPAATEGANDE